MVGPLQDQPDTCPASAVRPHSKGHTTGSADELTTALLLPDVPPDDARLLPPLPLLPEDNPPADDDRDAELPEVTPDDEDEDEDDDDDAPPSRAPWRQPPAAASQ